MEINHNGFSHVKMFQSDGMVLIGWCSVRNFEGSFVSDDMVRIHQVFQDKLT